MRRRDPIEPGLGPNQEGVYQTEYTIVLVLVAMVVAVAIGALSLPLIQYAQSIQDAVTHPVP